MTPFQKKEMPPPQQVEELLRRGLDFYALNDTADAARCWEQAAALDPSDTRATEYLAALRADGGSAESAAEEKPSAPERMERRKLTGLRQVVDELESPEAGAPRSFDRAQFVELLRAKKHEEALEVLYKMRHAVPDNASVSRGIQVLKDKLLSDYVARLGNLDLVVAPSQASGGPVTSDEDDVLKLADGIASLGDVLSASGLGRLPTARALAALLARGVLVARAPAEVAPPALPAGAAVRPGETAEAAGPTGSRYDETFRLATEAYLRRDVDLALTLFSQCLEERPSDRRVQHNIERLQQRKRKS